MPNSNQAIAITTVYGIDACKKASDMGFAVQFFGQRSQQWKTRDGEDLNYDQADSDYRVHPQDQAAYAAAVRSNVGQAIPGANIAVSGIAACKHAALGGFRVQFFGQRSQQWKDRDAGLMRYDQADSDYRIHPSDVNGYVSWVRNSAGVNVTTANNAATPAIDTDYGIDNCKDAMAAGLRVQYLKPSTGVWTTVRNPRFDLNDSNYRVHPTDWAASQPAPLAVDMIEDGAPGCDDEFGAMPPASVFAAIGKAIDATNAAEDNRRVALLERVLKLADANPNAAKSLKIVFEI